MGVALAEKKPVIASGSEWLDLSDPLGLPRGTALMSRRDRRKSDLQLGEHRSALAASLGFTEPQLAIPNQVHSATVQWIDKGGTFPETDGLFTANPDVVLTLRVADCAAVYFHHPPTGVRGLVHAGWRGAAGGILLRSLELLRGESIPMDEVLIAMGPMIRKECYEVGMDVANQFPDGTYSPKGEGKAALDLVGALVRQLTEEGIGPDHIRDTGICTRCDPGCHSYRRDGEKAGRMVGFLAASEAQ